MEVTTESGIMSGREPFSGGMQTNPIPPPPPMLNMRLAYSPDGTAFYQPIMSVPPPPYRGGGSTGGGGGPIPAVGSHSPDINMGIPGKKKRGRPRKYGPEGTMALALIPVSNGATASPRAGDFSPSPGALHRHPASFASSEATKKARARPSGLGKKQQMSALGSAGVGFTPHIITVPAGEDVSSKIMSFSQHGPRAICILSANGGICNVTIRQAATSGGTVTYEGRFEILTLSGSFMLSESDGQRSRTGGLSVSLAAPDGRIFGGGVAGPLTAATPVQVIVGSFIVDGKKEPKPMSPSNPTPPPPPPPPPPPVKLAPVGGPTAPQSPPSRITQTDDSSDSPGSPVNQSTGTSNNSNQHLIWN